MKAWKANLFGIVLFFGILVSLIYTSCEKNICDGVTCQHGGSCANGLCTCPTGYEGAQCQTLVTDRYVGTYVGYTTCDNLAEVLDTVTVAKDKAGILNVTMDMRSVRPKLLRGYVSSNVSTYRIIVTNNDSVANSKSHDFRTFFVTLQSDNKLSVHSYEDVSTPTDTAIHKCTFLGTKKL